jgi:RNA polymerase sigma-70 factor (ECF subfamily)
MLAEYDSDESLMRKVAHGDRGCLETLVRRYANPLLTFIQRMVGDRHRSEDLFQEVFLRVWTKRQAYQPHRSFRPWLYTIAANCCRADYRTWRYTETLSINETDEPLSSDSSPSDVAISRETATYVLNAVSRLPDQQRMVAVLRVWNDMPYAEIAEIMNSTESTVRSTMHRALAHIRKYLEPRLE